MKDFIGGFTALHYAAMHGRARIARLMLESDFRGDIINAKSNDGWTPLHVAAHYGRDSFVRLLLEFRAEVDPLSDKGTTPLQLAIIRERSSCVRILLDHSANIDIQNGFLLRYAVIKGNHSYCRMFLQRGADTNLGRLEDGQTPLHLSALRDDVLCAQMLYTYGANTNTRNYEGQTPVAVSVSMSGSSRPCLDFLQEVTSKSTPPAIPESGFTQMGLIANRTTMYQINVMDRAEATHQNIVQSSEELTDTWTGLSSITGTPGVCL